MDQGVMFWLLAGAMIAVVLALLLLPLLRRPKQALARAEYDLAIYRDQLRELDEEIAQGVIDKDAAERTRNEIARRILAADRMRRQAQAQLEGSGRGGVLAAIGATLLVPAAALAFYLNTGEPGRPDMPLQQRLADAARNNDLAALVKRAEQRLAQKPDDLRGWLALAPAYEQLGRLDKAVEAWRKAIELSDEPSADLYNAYAEAVVRVARGRIPEQAVRAFRKAQQLSPGDAMSRYYLAMADLQAGRRERAYDSLKKLLDDLPRDVPARRAVEQQVRQLAMMLGKAPGDLPPGPMTAAATASASSGPSAEAVRERMRAMQGASPQERMAMIRNMVENLDARLREDPNDLGGWLRLIRARKVLGEDDKARAAFRRANEVFAGNEEARKRLAALAARMGLASAAPPSGPMTAAERSAPAPKVADASGASSSGPSAEAVRERMRAMQGASPQERMAMIRNMVENLDARLREDPNDLGGWLRLIRARKVLGEDDKARAAFRRANEVFAGNEEARKRLAALAARMGLTP